MSQRPEVAGSFRQHPLPKLLFYLYRKQFTGMMSVRQAGGESRVFFRDGMPVAAEMAEAVEPIGRILLELGLIDENVYNLSLAQAAKTGQRQGDILQASGAVVEEQIDHVLKLQLHRKMLRLFKGRESQFALYREDHTHGRAPEEAAKMRVHPRRIIYHGIRNAYDMPRLREEIGDALTGQLVRLDLRKVPNLDRYQFSTEDQVLLDLLRNKFWDLESLQTAAQSGELDVWMMVYTLLVTDMMELQQGSMKPAITPTGLAGGEVEHRPIATPMPFQPPPGSRVGGTASRMGSLPPPPRPSTAPQSELASRPGFHASGSGSMPAATRSTQPPQPSGSQAPRAGSQAPRSGSQAPRSGSNPPNYEPPRSGSRPPRSGSNPPNYESRRPGSNPPRPGSSPPRPGSNPPRPGSNPPRQGSMPPRSGSQPPRPGSNPRPVMTTAEIRALTPDALALKQQIDDKLKYLERKNHFEMLGVERNATKDQIKAAYISNAKTFHPDRLAQFKLEPMRSEVEKIFQRVSEAQSVLLDERRRKEYTDTLDGAARGDAEKARKLLQAEVLFREAEMAMRHKNFAEAEEKFKQSVEFNPEEGEHHAMLAWCIYQNPAHSKQGVLEQVKVGLAKAIKLGRNNPRPYYLLGELFLAENDLDKAIGYFRKALELREDHVEAERGLRLATMRKEKDTKKGGWFRKK